MIAILAIAFLFIYEPNKTTQYIPIRPSTVYEVQKKKTSNEVASIRRFFESYNSILAPYAQEFYDISKVEGLDYRILPSIAMVESTGGKFLPSCAEFNPFGWSSSTSPCGFYRFSSFKEAIEGVGQGISRNRAYDRYKQSKEVGVLAEIYNPGGKEKWEKDLRYFMDRF